MNRPLLLALLLSSTLSGAPALRADTADEQLAAASAQFDAHKYADAARTLDAFLAAHPTHPKAGAAALALGRCRSELKQWAQAIPAYQKAADSKDPSVTTLAELGLGEAAMQTSRWAVAAGALEAATRTTLTPEQGAVAWNWLGQADFQMGHFAPADQAYQTVIQKYSDSDYAADAYFGAGLAEVRLGHLTSARKKLQAIVSRYQGSPDRPQALAQLGQLDLDANHYDQARDEFNEALSAPSLDSDTRQAADEGLVAALLKLGRYDEAATRLQATLARLPANDPERPRVELTLGNCLYQQKHYEGALTAYQDAARSSDPAVAAEGAYWAANTQLALKRPTEAAALFAQVADHYPNSTLAAKAQLRAGDALADAGQTAAAMRAYQVVLSKFPQSPEASLARKALGGALQATNDPAQLAAALQNTSGEAKVTGTLRLARLYLDAKKDAPAAAALTGLLDGTVAVPVSQRAEAEYLLGLADDGLARPAPAAAALAKAVQEAPTADWAPDAQTRLAWLYVGLKQPDKAEAAAQAALAVAGDSSPLEEQARLALAQADLDQQKWDAASEQCTALLAGHPSPATTATVLYTQAWISEKQNKLDDALPLWQRLVSDYPKSDYAPEALLHIADARFAAAQYDAAATQYAALLTQYPQSAVAPEARFKRGSSLYNLGRYAEAAAEFDQVAADKKAGDYQAEGLYWAGASWQKAGKNPQAIQRLTRLVSDFPDSKHVANAKIRLAALKAVGGG